MSDDTPDVPPAPQSSDVPPPPYGDDDQPPMPELTLGSGETAESTVDPNWKPIIRGKIDKKTGAAIGTGRRKTAVARVRLTPGDGTFTVNGRPMEEFFCVYRDQQMVQAPLKATNNLGKYNVWCRVNGGGPTGQTGAVVLGIARALQALDPGQHHILSDGGFLTRDSRMVERKKYGKKGARRSFQFSKR